MAVNFSINFRFLRAARGGAVGCVTSLQAGRSRVRFQMVSLKFFFNWLTTLPPSCAVVLKSESLYRLVTSGSVHAVTGIVFTLTLILIIVVDLKIQHFHYVSHLCYLGLFQFRLHLHVIRMSLFRYNPLTWNWFA
jgi:hypothetical protein